MIRHSVESRVESVTGPTGKMAVVTPVQTDTINYRQIKINMPQHDKQVQVDSFQLGRIPSSSLTSSTVTTY